MPGDGSRDVRGFTRASPSSPPRGWFFLPYGIACGAEGLWGGAARNLLVVTAGNVAGGTLPVAGVYRLAYLRRP